MIAPGAWVLAADFGTTNTVASIADAHGVRTLTIDGKPVMPSAVLLLDGDRQNWMVGDSAVNMARRRLEWYEPSPKRAIDDQMLFLGGQDVPLTEAIAQVFRVVASESDRQHNGRAPAIFVITHPATWTDSRIQILKDAARMATSRLRGWPPPSTLSEPEAAAQRTLEIQDIPQRGRLVVLDLGGGTVDVTVVDREGASLRVVGRPSGIDRLGGEDFDLRLARWMVAEVGAEGLYDALAISDDPDERERAVDIRSHARAVKEQLSRVPVVPASLPKSPPVLERSTPVQVNKTQLEKLIRGGDGHDPGLAEAVELVTETLQRASPGPPFIGVYLVGGSSRIPLLGALVSESVEVVPLTHGDPSTAVADGAAQWAWRSLEQGRGFDATQRTERADRGNRGNGSRSAGAAGSAGPAGPAGPGRAPPGGRGGPRRAPDNDNIRHNTPERPTASIRPKHRRRRWVLSLLAVLLLGGGAAIAYAAKQHRNDSPFNPTPTFSFSSAAPSSSFLPPSFSAGGSASPGVIPAPGTTLAFLNQCSNSNQLGCTTAIRSASYDVWPQLRTVAAGDPTLSNCRVGDSNLGRLYLSCLQQSVEYLVVWRRPGEARGTPIADAYRDLMTDPSERSFKLKDNAEILGTTVEGDWTDDTGAEWHGCVREYRNYPIALLIDGRDVTATATACRSSVFYGSTRISEALTSTP